MKVRSKVRKTIGKRAWLAILSMGLTALVLAAPAQGATDPLFVLTPSPPPPPLPVTPPPSGFLNGPCGAGVDSTGKLYVSDYYHHIVDVFKGTIPPLYSTQLTGVDPGGGPCGLVLSPTDNSLYVNNYHRNITKFDPLPSFGTGTLFPLPAEDTKHHLPTGVGVDVVGNLFTDNRTYVAELDSAGNPVLDGEGHPVKIGVGSLGDGYGVAVSAFPGTLGRVYVPDASTNTVKAYDPSVSKTTPVAEIKDPFNKPFVSLRDSAVAVDRVTGDVYFADNVQPSFTEQPQATIYIYSSTGNYKGHLKYNAIDALPPGLAVDNSGAPTQGRVYVTSGNTSGASVYGYGPSSGTFAAPLPPIGSGLQPPGSSSGAGGAASAGAVQAAGASGEAPASASVVAQKENLRVSVTGKLSPKRLPRKGTAPISVSVGWDIATIDGSPPPKLKTLQVEINRNGRFDSEGLPTCPYAKIQPATTQRALANCKAALVGQGSFSANIALKGQEGESYAAQGKLLVFNGEDKGKPVLFGQIYSAHPFATSFVIVFAVKQVSKGTYGTLLRAELPKALRSWGDLTGIEMNLSRRYGFNGERHSYVSAGCPAPKGFGLASFKLARTSFAFSGGAELATTVVGECRVRG
jgi:hypothetical protein